MSEKVHPTEKVNFETIFKHTSEILDNEGVEGFFLRGARLMWSDKGLISQEEREELEYKLKWKSLLRREQVHKIERLLNEPQERDNLFLGWILRGERPPLDEWIKYSLVDIAEEWVNEESDRRVKKEIQEEREYLEWRGAYLEGLAQKIETGSQSGVVAGNKDSEIQKRFLGVIGRSQEGEKISESDWLPDRGKIVARKGLLRRKLSFVKKEKYQPYEDEAINLLFEGEENDNTSNISVEEKRKFVDDFISNFGSVDELFEGITKVVGETVLERINQDIEFLSSVKGIGERQEAVARYKKLVVLRYLYREGLLGLIGENFGSVAVGMLGLKSLANASRESVPDEMRRLAVEGAKRLEELSSPDYEDKRKQNIKLELYKALGVNPNEKYLPAKWYSLIQRTLIHRIGSGSCRDKIMSLAGQDGSIDDKLIGLVVRVVTESLPSASPYLDQNWSDFFLNVLHGYRKERLSSDVESVIKKIKRIVSLVKDGYTAMSINMGLVLDWYAEYFDESDRGKVSSLVTNLSEQMEKKRVVHVMPGGDSKRLSLQRNVRETAVVFPYSPESYAIKNLLFLNRRHWDNERMREQHESDDALIFFRLPSESET